MLLNGESQWLDHPRILRVAFHPRPERGGDRGEGFDVLDIPVDHSVTIGARFYAAAPDAPNVVFFHGNGEIVADYDELARLVVRMGINFFPVDYRGYGRSTGQPSFSTLLADAHTTFTFARNWLLENGFKGSVFVMGRSLGSAPALEIAAAHPDQIGGLILDSAFADIGALLTRLGARLPDDTPEDTLLRQTHKIGTYAGPTLIIHGTADQIIPISDAETLYDASPASYKRFLRIAGAGHNNLLATALPAYMAAISELLGAHR